MRVKMNEVYDGQTNMSSDVSRHQSTDIPNFKTKIMETDFELATLHF